MKSCDGKSVVQSHMSSKKKGPVANNASGFAISAIAFAVALLAASPQIARAANECGVEASGQAR
jgi:hypothetical protein